MKKQSSREAMPVIAVWLDSLREAFGKECIDEQLMSAKRGNPVFYAVENGYEFGAVDTSAKSCVVWDTYFRSRVVEIPSGMAFEAARDLLRKASSGDNLGEIRNG